MSITVEDCSPDADALKAMADGLANVGVDADVHVSGDFVSTVRELTNSTTYDTTRGADVVGARTLNVEGGQVIVVNWAEASRLGLAGLTRLLAHEAGHVLLYKRGEHASDYQYLAATEGDWHLLCMASNAAEEYRIEVGVIAHGHRASDTASNEQLTESLVSLNSEILSSVVPGISIENMCQTVLAAQRVITKVLGYTAAAHGPGSDTVTEALDEASAEHWADYIRATWADRAQLWQALPDAWTRMTPGQWEKTLTDGLEIERRLLDDLGFVYERPDKHLRFQRTGSSDLFDVRVERLRRDFDL